MLVPGAGVSRVAVVWSCNESSTGRARRVEREGEGSRADDPLDEERGMREESASEHLTVDTAFSQWQRREERAPTKKTMEEGENKQK